MRSHQIGIVFDHILFEAMKQRLFSNWCPKNKGNPIDIEKKIKIIIKKYLFLPAYLPSTYKE